MFYLFRSGTIYLIKRRTKVLRGYSSTVSNLNREYRRPESLWGYRKLI